MEYFPLFLDLRGRDVLIVGGGEVACRKLGLVCRAGAHPRVVAPSVTDEALARARQAGGTVRRRRYRKGDLAGCALGIVAVGDGALNDRVQRDARLAGVPLNVVDSPRHCDFIFPAIIDRGPVVVGVTSSGRSPVLARRIRTRIEGLLPSGLGRLADFCGSMRALVQEALPESARRLFWEEVIDGPAASRALAGDDAGAEAMVRGMLAARGGGSGPAGEAYLIGAGPGDADLMTVKAVRLLQQADVVVHDRLVSPAVLELARRDARRVFAGKARGKAHRGQEEINALLVDLVRSGRRVARLKGGDPLVFGRGGEEALALAEAGLPFQIVPGVSAANGCAAYAGIPLTHRGVSRGVRFVTVSDRDWDDVLLWRRLADERDVTLVFYMSGRILRDLASRLVGAGRPGSTPVAVVSQGTTAAQRTATGTLSRLPGLADGPDLSPALVIVGETVALRGRLGWYCDGAFPAEFPQIA